MCPRTRRTNGTRFKWDKNLLTAKDYPRFAFINKTLAFYRAHNDSITIATNRSKLNILYLLAKAYFVENHVKDKVLRGKFNTKILGSLLRGHGRKSGLGVKSVQDFYMEKDKDKVDYVFMAKSIGRRWQHCLRQFLR